MKSRVAGLAIAGALSAYLCTPAAADLDPAHKGGTMRLGAYDCDLTPGSLAQRAYNTSRIAERHRHRYEFNCLYEKSLTDKGLEIVGRSLDGKFVEIIELPSHPWYVAVQFHPEFKSKPLKPHPLFAGFVEAGYAHRIAAGHHAAASVVG